MGWQIVKQPNGRYARYSKVVDDFTPMNFTAEEMVDYLQKRQDIGRQTAESMVAATEAEYPEAWNCNLYWCARIQRRERAKEVRTLGNMSEEEVAKLEYGYRNRLNK